jgi:hypothetical protein
MATRGDHAAFQDKLNGICGLHKVGANKPRHIREQADREGGKTMPQILELISSPMHTKGIGRVRPCTMNAEKEAI